MLKSVGYLQAGGLTNRFDFESLQNLHEANWGLNVSITCHLCEVFTSEPDNNKRTFLILALPSPLVLQGKPLS